MDALLWLVPALPLAGFLILLLTGARLPRAAVSAIGVGSVAAAAIVTVTLARHFLALPPDTVFHQTLWTIFDLDGLRVDAALRLDALSLVMTLVVTVVGSLIHLYSTAYMRDDDGLRRFFAYMNLFVGSMLMLVLADNLLLLYLGLGRRRPVQLPADRLLVSTTRPTVAPRPKAFIVTRIGDVAWPSACSCCSPSSARCTFQRSSNARRRSWAAGSAVATLAAALVAGRRRRQVGASCRCRCGCPTPWPARRRSAR